MKVLKVIGKILLIIVIIIGLFIGGLNLFQRIGSKDFYKSAEKEFIIPGLSDGFVPCGISFDDNSGYYLISGYMRDGSASRIYTVDSETSDYSFVSLKNSSTHGSGIAVYGRYVILTTDKDELDIYRLADVTNTDLTEVSPFATFATDNTPANLYVNGDTLYVGELYIPKTNETPESHRYETDAGDDQKALMLTYDVSELIRSLSLDDGDEVEPICAYAITDYVQGICILKGGQICLSTSKSMKASVIKIYDDPEKTNLTSDNKYTLSNGNDIPVYYLDSEDILKQYKLPPMVGELYAQGDKLLALTKSASNKYILGKLTGARNCYSFYPEY